MVLFPANENQVKQYIVQLKEKMTVFKLRDNWLFLLN